MLRRLHRKVLHLGASAKAEKDSSVAIGYFAKATDGATNGVSIGRSASVTKSNGVALGYISVADREAVLPAIIR